MTARMSLHINGDWRLDEGPMELVVGAWLCSRYPPPPALCQIPTSLNCDGGPMELVGDELDLRRSTRCTPRPPSLRLPFSRPCDLGQLPRSLLLARELQPPASWMRALQAPAGSFSPSARSRKRSFSGCPRSASFSVYGDVL